MMRDWIVSKEVRDVKVARWEGFKQLAKRLPDHHVLSVELVRTEHDETAAVLTIVRDGQPVQYVVMGDAQGRVKPQQREPDPDKPRADAQPTPHLAMAAGTSPSGDGSASPASVALGEPPVKQPPTPGIVAFGSALMTTTFALGEQA